MTWLAVAVLGLCALPPSLAPTTAPCAFCNADVPGGGPYCGPRCRFMDEGADQ